MILILFIFWKGNCKLWILIPIACFILQILDLVGRERSWIFIFLSKHLLIELFNLFNLFGMICSLLIIKAPLWVRFSFRATYDSILFLCFTIIAILNAVLLLFTFFLLMCLQSIICLSRSYTCLWFSTPFTIKCRNFFHLYFILLIWFCVLIFLFVFTNHFFYFY